MDEMTEEEVIVDNQEIFPTRKGKLVTRCKCGAVANATDDIIEDGINFTMIVGEETFIRLNCEKCGTQIELALEEVFDNKEDEFPKESN